MEGISESKKKEYGQKNIGEGGINPKSPRAKLEEIKALRAANRITSKIEKPKKTTSSINPRSPRAQLEARKSLERANKITTRPATKTTLVDNKTTRSKTTTKKDGKLKSKLTQPLVNVAAKPKVDAKPKPTSFADAFKQAKGKKTFEFKGKKYARVTADEVKKAGFASLKDYLNAPRKTQIAKK